MHADDDALPSTQPYLLRALHEWCTDNGFTPYLAVQVDGSVQVPPEFVRDGQIVLNLSYDATDKLQMGNEYIEFQARFGGVARQIIVPVHRVLAIYARENNQGMAFTVSDSYLAPAPAESAPPKPTLAPSATPVTEGDEPPDGNGPAPASKRPALRLVK
ncbi:ClpXP protease specificity-enhancing factor [Allofranklinella schreckenbergeri]|uniref:ClpXP protease specificity-enhancing factor n=1 Tax=Allofranklinella schreckenbergeri TaxID=1076744 RepID=A0A3M6QGI4_9BURK|nr:ClpXP protease specificity-enhancing factor [Allofranklinella schreckenbergeri]RMW99636.1 ClpXP protease specificity-enhancing factor [Allofranklinella schreckenbergeri]RMX02015.1 ClpXP protease specificity-enhancing factor [Allofranklinella schreckenbergeri]